MKISFAPKLIALCIFAFFAFTLQGCAVLFAGAAGAGAGAMVASDSRTVENMVNDETIEQAAAEVLRSNKILSDSSVFSVSAYSMSGNVLLAGQTTNSDYLAWCVSQIEKLDYVRRVFNYVEIMPPVSPSVVASDSYITSQIRAHLLFADKVRSGRFKVVTENSVVFLMGLVMKDEANRAVNLVSSYQNVKKVVTIFDYITDQPELKETGYTTTDNIQIERVDSNTQQYQTQGSSSTYVEPVSSDMNGGAVIVDDSSYLPPDTALEGY